MTTIHLAKNLSGKPSEQTDHRGTLLEGPLPRAEWLKPRERGRKKWKSGGFSIKE